MAKRPVFYVKNDKLYESTIEFTWYSGFALQQKQKSINSLHNQIADKFNVEISEILEISSKSKNLVGVALSAFNLKLKINEKNYSIESIFQSSKVFEYGGAYNDILNLPPSKAKKDVRLKESGMLTGFRFLNELWPKEPKTLFYDWIYMKSVYANRELHEKLINFKYFTDIEFNPKKSYNCQARSAALYVYLYKKGILEKLLTDKDEYKKYFKKEEYSQMSMFNDSDFYQ